MNPSAQVLAWLTRALRLSVGGPRIVVYTARPGSRDAQKLDVLRVTGLQTLGA